MKKTFFLLTTFCLLLTSYVGATDCSYTTYSGHCTAYTDDSNSQSFYFSPTSGLSIDVYGYVPISGTAYAYVSWPTTGSLNYYDHYPSASHSHNYFDSYAVAGTISMGAAVTGSGSHAGASVYW
jgi:hypothetical protein